MSRTRRPAPVPSEAEPPHGSGPMEGRLVGYRIVRRIASGARADVYLAAAESAAVPEPVGLGANADWAPPPSDGPREADRPTTVLVVLRVYAAGVADDEITNEIEAMSADATGTLPSLIDVANLEDGRCCLIVERLGGRPLSRLLGERRLSPGEAVTVLAPLAVAVGELARAGFVHGRLSTSDVVLDDDGRPRLLGLGALRRLPGPGEARAALQRTGHEALADLFDEVGSAVAPAGALEDVFRFLRGRLSVRPFEPCVEEVERRLFAAATPEAVRGFTPRAAPRVAPTRAIPPIQADVVPDASPEPHRADRPFVGGLRRALSLLHGPDEFVEQIADAAELESAGRLRGRIADAIGRRRGALVVGGLVGGGALVLLLTMVPPAPADGHLDEASAAERISSTDAETAGVAGADHPDQARVTETAGPADRIGADEDPVVAAGQLLEERATCFETLDLGCLDGVDQPGSAIETADHDAIARARDGSAEAAPRYDPASIAVTADMGAAVLVHAETTAEREPASLLMVRGEAGWRLRDVFD